MTPPRVFVTTSWDDGHILDVRLAELLERHGLTGTFYVAPKSRELPARARLSVAALRVLADRFEIGGHTLTHPRLPSITLSQAASEIRQGKEDLEQSLGARVCSFAYPGGTYDMRHLPLVRKAGFVMARTVQRHITVLGSDPLQVGTTVHAYRHWTDVNRIFRRGGLHVLDARKLLWHWDVFAFAMFDQVFTDGGIFHLWGHSWEIDNHGDWDRLDRVLAYIGGRPDVAYVTNAELPIPPFSPEAASAG